MKRAANWKSSDARELIKRLVLPWETRPGRSQLRRCNPNLNQAAAEPPFPDTAIISIRFLQEWRLKSAAKWLKVAAKTNPAVTARVQYQLGSVYRKQGREARSPQAVGHVRGTAPARHSREQDKAGVRQKLVRARVKKRSPSCEQLYDLQNEKNLRPGHDLWATWRLERAFEAFAAGGRVAPQSPQMQYNPATPHYKNPA